MASSVWIAEAPRVGEVPAHAAVTEPSDLGGRCLRATEKGRRVPTGQDEPRNLADAEWMEVNPVVPMLPQHSPRGAGVQCSMGIGGPYWP